MLVFQRRLLGGAAVNRCNSEIKWARCLHRLHVHTSVNRRQTKKDEWTPGINRPCLALGHFMLLERTHANLQPRSVHMKHRTHRGILCLSGLGFPVLGLKSNLTTKPGPPELLRNAGLDFNGVHLPQPFRVGLAGLGSEASFNLVTHSSGKWHHVGSCGASRQSLLPC